MYWPTGVPQVYAHHVTEETFVTEHDDELHGNITNGVNGTINDGEPGTEGPDDVEQPRDQPVKPGNGLIDLQVPRHEHIFGTLTSNALAIWSVRPTLILATLKRSKKSLETYGENVATYFRPDGSLVVLRTSLGFLILYAVETDPTARVLQQRTRESQSRKQSLARTFGVSEVNGVPELSLRFRKTIKIDAGIRAVVPTDSDLIVATSKPAAIQCIKWETHRGLHQTSTQLLSRLTWLEGKRRIVQIIHDRAMNLSVWLDDKGNGYAVRKVRPQAERRRLSEESSQSSASSIQPTADLFDGFRFHIASNDEDKACSAAINARFSLLAIATTNGRIMCYAAKDYAGNIPLSHVFTANTISGRKLSVTSLAWSPDGYCLFAGFESGWATWSVFGKEGASSFGANMTHAETNEETWLCGIRSATWVSNGAEMLLTSPRDHRVWRLDFSRSAAVGCFSCANLVRALQQNSTAVAVYRGHELPDLTSISNDASLWHHAQYPLAYMHNQWPIKTTVISQDGRYIAIAGRRGLAHYSVVSGRWRGFADFSIENAFAVRGGMSWFGHILAVATEHAQGYDIRLYSRDQELGRTPLHSESFSMPVAFMGPSGDDSLLVYTYENILYHFILNITDRGAQLLQVGQIAFHGVVRAPSRVRSVSWILPDNQLRNGDPSRDVEYAAVLFLIDDKLVLLHPSRTPEEGIKYDMRVIANQVEYYILMRDQMYFNFEDNFGESAPPTPAGGVMFSGASVHYSLRDSLWIFTGNNLCLWSDVRDLLQSMLGLATTKQALITIPVDFYPLSILLNKGIVLGMESELLQRRDVNFAQSRTVIRTQLFLPYALRYTLLETQDTAIAFALAHQYQNLTYFPHALEILLHIVLDAEVDRRKGSTSNTNSSLEPLPAVLSFLQVALSQENYLSTIVQCVRKTEFSFWKYLFAHLPSPKAMFEEALSLGDLKTASGYLIVMQTFDEEHEDEIDDATDLANRKRFEDQVIRLMSLAKAKHDFELCSELARFMIGIDPRGDTLRRVTQKVGFRGNNMYLQPAHARLSVKNVALQESEETSVKPNRLTSLGKLDVRLTRLLAEEPPSAGAESEVMSRSSAGDYFSASPGEFS